MNILVDKINTITRDLNNLNLKPDVKNKKRQERTDLIQQLIKEKEFNKDEKYFLLPYVKPDCFVSYNIAIVGNSINLKTQTYGNEIDQHSDIVRFNYAPVKGFEQYCGSKSTFRICGYPALSGTKPPHHPKMDNIVYDLKSILENNKILIFYHRSNQLTTALKNRKSYEEKGNTFFSIQWDIKAFNDILKFLNIKLMNQNPQCGTGIMLLLADLSIIPDIYGLDTKKCKDNYYYYWDDKNKKCTKMSTSHNYNDEFRIPLELQKLGKINLITSSQ